MNLPINTAIALQSLDSPMTTLGSARRDRAVRRQVTAMGRRSRHEHVRHRRTSPPPPL